MQTIKMKDKTQSEPVVPVLVDSTVQPGDSQRIRCVYFRLDLSEEATPFYYGADRFKNARFALQGNWAVLIGSRLVDNIESLFASPDSINRTLTEIYETEGLNLDIGYIWVPFDLLGSVAKSSEIRMGDVYRMSLRLFGVCYRFTTERIGEEEWLSMCMSYKDEITLSSDETRAFRQWRIEQIKTSRDNYQQGEYAKRRMQRKSESK
ncbi:MAG: hypothetical protein OEW48_09245 [Phycisphaerae bacterium]|nr:hypothetical protein [Phycisphaerae bacterium]